MGRKKSLQQEKQAEEQNESIISYRTLDQDTSKYYYTMLHRLNAPFEDEEEKSIFYKNCLEQTVDDELNVCCDRHGGPFITTLLRESALSPTDIFRFCRSVLEDLSGVTRSPNGSKVLEQLLLTVLRLTQREDETERELFFDWILAVSKFFKANYEEFIADVFGHHVIARLFRILIGKNTTYQRDKRSIQGLKNLSNAVPDAEVFDFKVPDTFKKSLTKIVKKMFKSPKLYDYANEKLSSTLLCDLLRILSTSDAELCQFAVRRLVDVLLPQNSTDSPEVLFSDFPNFLLRSALSAADEKAVDLIAEKMIPHLDVICAHNSANHTLQELLLCCKSKEQFERFFDLIIPHLGKLHECGFHGAFANISRACLQMDCCQAKLVQKVQDFLEIPSGEDSTGRLVSHILTLKKFDKTDGGSCLEYNKISIYGSSTVQNMLGFHKTNKIVGSILTLSPANLTYIAQDKVGCFVFDSYFNSTFVGDKKTMQLINKLKPIMKDISRSQSGSTTLIKVFEVVPIKFKALMAEGLCCAEVEHGNECTKFVYNKLNLKHFKLRKQDWLDAQNRSQKKRKIIDQIFGEQPKRSK